MSCISYFLQSVKQTDRSGAELRSRRMVLKIHFINSFGGACVVGNHDGAVAEGTFMILGDTAK